MLIISEKDHTKELPVRAIDEVEIVLFENAGAGYQWNISTTKGIEIIENRYEKGSAATGSGGHHHWLIRFNEPGRQKIQGLYQRPWEKNIRGTEFEVTFVVALV